MTLPGRMQMRRTVCFGIWIVLYRGKIWHTGTSDLSHAIEWVLERESRGETPNY